MPISSHIAHLRHSIGHDLLLLPSVTVLPRDEIGRILLVRHADTGRWGTIGGAVEVDEHPATTAVREAAEEAGVHVELTQLVAALGGPQFRLTYPNGDQTAYVSVVYEARVIAGRPQPDADETIDVAWVAPAELPGLPLSDFARHSFSALGLLQADPGECASEGR